jgi:uncharacterized protein
VQGGLKTLQRAYSRLRMEHSKVRNARYWIEELKLAPHPEGGHFRQTYKSDLTIPAKPCLMAQRTASTGIYFLVEGENFSAFHRLRSDEMWRFYAGSPLHIEIIASDGAYSNVVLGSDPEDGQVFQAVVSAGCWFASHVADWKGWALVGCTVAPGFEFEDFEMAKRREPAEQFPQHRRLIDRLTRK